METGERTEKATPKRRREARERGQVRKSTEVIIALMLLALFGALRLLGPWMWGRMAGFLRAGLSGSLFMGESLTAGDIPTLLTKGTLELGITVLPILGVAFLAAVAANLMQVGFLFSGKALAPKFGRLNPISGLKRIFSFNTLYDLFKSICKVIVIAYIASGRYMAAMDQFKQTAWQDPVQAGTVILTLITNMGFAVGIALLVIAVLDFAYQWWKYEKDLRMTKYEVKLEYKQQEGDPLIKSRIRQKQRQLAMSHMMQAVPEADVVITNPTHYAVALKYDEQVSDAPKVVAKGQGYVAMRIKEIAKEHGVELVENKPVAQALYKLCEVGDEIPVEFYQAVAEILAYVYRLKNER